MFGCHLQFADVRKTTSLGSTSGNASIAVTPQMQKYKYRLSNCVSKKCLSAFKTRKISVIKEHKTWCIKKDTSKFRLKSHIQGELDLASSEYLTNIM